MYGNCVPVGPAGGDLFEYINFQQRYDINARIERARCLAEEYLLPLAPGELPRNSVDLHVDWMQFKQDVVEADAALYRRAKRSEQLRVADELRDLYTTAGILMVDAQGHDIISAKIASTVHDTFHAFMLSELDRNGKTTPDMFESINLRLAESITARNLLGAESQDVRENATMLYGEVRPGGHFRFVDFGHPPPLIFSLEQDKLIEVCGSCMVRFLPLGMAIPEDHPDRNRYLSMAPRAHELTSGDISELQLMRPGDILLLYTDGVYDGSDEEIRLEIEQVIRDNRDEPAKVICNEILKYAISQDEFLRLRGEDDRVDDKTAFVVKWR